jgi:hypothetical protein
MTGSVVDGEDVVQESILRAYAMMESGKVVMPLFSTRSIGKGCGTCSSRM